MVVKAGWVVVVEEGARADAGYEDINENDRLHSRGSAIGHFRQELCDLHQAIFGHFRPFSRGSAFGHFRPPPTQQPPPTHPTATILSHDISPLITVIRGEALYSSRSAWFVCFHGTSVKDRLTNFKGPGRDIDEIALMGAG